MAIIIMEMFTCLFRSCLESKPSSERYTEKTIIGGGSFSVIVLANDNLMGRKVVLKKAKNTAEKREIAAEYRILNSLDHPNIIKPKDFINEGLGFMVLPHYMQDMYMRMAKKKPSNAEMKIIVRNMISAINYLHSQDIVHRDIKPENILMNKDYSSIVLTDFGMATKISGNPTNICGTLSYIAPEAAYAASQRDFKSYIDWKKCDVFSLGVTFYTMFEFKSLLYERACNEGFTPDQEDIDEEIDSMTCNNNLKDLLKKMIVVEPKARISMADIVLHPYIL